MLLECTLAGESWPLREPFEISRGVMTEIKVLVVRLRDEQGRSGYGEATGVPYKGETQATMAAQIEAVRGRLQVDLGSADLMTLLPPGGARNALDCALWDLRAKQAGRSAWQMAGLSRVDPVLTAYTIGLGSEADVRRKIRAARHLPLLKLKADGTRHLDMVRFAREEHPAARLVIDANQAWSRELLERILPELQAQGVELIEQPVERGHDAALDGLSSPIPLAADESCVDRGSLPELVGRYQYVNIKLDKSGGLTEGLALAREAKRLGFGLMVGNMGGTSLAMAPAHLIAQECAYVDLDGPMLMSADRSPAMRYEGAMLEGAEVGLWG
ncbi:MAG: dipeptide epimerase [Mitsuaria chitosanitabida]|uniref:N-acetyl-D-Glu racemase DgcA n=1 Tax=Roseateles chitosanitabidus TaxID=65048 RepID=UPI001B03C2FB|nr:N-acetyl-D-Glu racemase DgcA [Roseateles chitosanitabidus]MBO9689272.1 dipeptide epimerase [Roseateles chitosanitabidus]